MKKLKSIFRKSSEIDAEEFASNDEGLLELLSGKQINIQSAYQKIEIMNSSIRYITDNLGKLDYKYYKNNKEIENLPTNITKFLKYVNPLQNIDKIIKQMVLFLEIYGEYYLFLDKKSKSAYFLNPTTIKKEFKNGVLIFLEKDYKSRNRIYTSDEIIFDYDSELLNILKTQSPLYALKNQISMEYNWKDNLTGKFKNGVFLDGLVFLKNVTKLEKLKKISLDVNSLLKKFRMPVLTEGNYTGVDTSKTLTAYQAILEKNDKDIFRHFGIPSVLLNDNKQSTYNNLKTAEQLFKSNCLIGKAKRICNGVSQLLWKMFMYDVQIKPDINSFSIVASPEEQAKVDALNINSGVATINEIRKRDGKEDKPDCDIPLPIFRLQSQQIILPEEEKKVDLLEPEKIKIIKEFPTHIKMTKTMRKTLKAKKQMGLAIRLKMQNSFLKFFMVTAKKEVLKHFKKYYLGKSLDELSNLDDELILLLNSGLTYTYQMSSESCLKNIEKYGIYLAGKDIDLTNITDSIIPNLLDSAHFSDMSSDMILDLKRVVRQGFDEGLGSAELAKRITEKMDLNYPHRADRIARTEMQKLSGTTSFDIEKSLGYKKQIWISSLSDTTRN